MDFREFQKQWGQPRNMEEIIAEHSRSRERRKYVESEFPEEDPYRPVEERVPIRASKQHKITKENRDELFKTELFQLFETFRTKYGVDSHELAIEVFCNILLVKKRMRTAYYIDFEISFIGQGVDDWVDDNLYDQVRKEMHNTAKDLVIKYYDEHIGVYNNNPDEADRYYFYNKLLISEDNVKLGVQQTDIFGILLNYPSKNNFRDISVSKGRIAINADNIHLFGFVFPWENKKEIENLMSYRIKMFQKILGKFGYTITMKVDKIDA